MRQVDCIPYPLGKAGIDEKSFDKANDQKIKVGDFVRIIDPQIFIRCGYPLCIKDVMASLDSSIAIDAIKKATGATYDQYFNSDDRCIQKAIREINRGVALAIMISKGFGGSKRTIYTEHKPKYKDRIVKVQSKRQVVTGDRWPGCGPGYYGDEAEGPSLENQKRHTLISFWPVFYDIDLKVCGASITDSNSGLEIEQIHVEKINL